MAIDNDYHLYYPKSMTNNEQEMLREKINAEINHLEKSLDGLTESSKPVEPDNAIGRLSRMEAINAKSISENSLVNLKNRIAKLKIALTKLSDTNFGICSICEEPIPMGRLVLVPESSVCVNCAGR